MAQAPRRPEDGQKPGHKTGPQRISQRSAKVDIPAEPGEAKPAAGPAKPGPAPAAQPVKRPPTGEQRNPMSADSRGGPKTKTQLLSLEPPKRQDGPRLAPGARMDGIGARMRGAGKGPAMSSTRFMGGKDDKADLFGRKKTDEINKRLASEPPPAPRPTPEGYDPAQHMARRKHTVRVPRPGGGGVMGDNNAALDRMADSGRRPAVPASSQGPSAPPRANVNVPPVAPLPAGASVAKAPDISRKSDLPPPAPGYRTSTLAGVSAEELLGAEGKALMEQVKNRQAERRPPDDTRKVKQGGLYNDPPAPGQRTPTGQARVAPIPVAPVAAQPYVAPIPAYVPPPPQFPEPPTGDTPPSDDLGYERPVDFGDGGSAPTSSSGEVVVEDDDISAEDIAAEEEAARESQAQEEMEQRVGYMLWLQGVITVEEIEEAIRSADPSESRDEILLLLNNSGFTGQESLYRFLARHESLAPVDLSTAVPTDNALGTLRPAVARAYRVIPLAVLGKILLVAASMPFDPARLLELRSLTGRKVKVFVASPEDIDAALKKYYPGGPRAPSGRQEAVNEKTGEVPKLPASGEKLAEGYDPTVRGEDSGLYVAVNKAGRAGSDRVAMESADDAAPSTTGFSATESTQLSRGPKTPVGEDADLDESALSGGGDPLGDDELKIGNESAKPEKKAKHLDSGPEDLDPFGD